MNAAVMPEDATCLACGITGAIRIEWRMTYIVRPPGTWSLSGDQVKMVASEIMWPWAVCRTDLGGCGKQSMGKHEVGADDLAE